jgi:hypothetical protein
MDTEVSNNEGPGDGILEKWGPIADYLRCSIKTAQRWEKNGLPIYRHEGVGCVWAHKTELDQWREGRASLKKAMETPGAGPSLYVGRDAGSIYRKSLPTQP